MHIFFNAGKTDNEKILRAEEGRFEGEPQPPWELTTSQLSIVQERLMHLSIPAHLDVNYKYLFSHPSRLKSHDWKQVFTTIYVHTCIYFMHLFLMRLHAKGS